MNKNVHIMNEEEIRRLDEIKSHFTLRNMETDEIISMDDFDEKIPQGIKALTLNMFIYFTADKINKIFENEPIPEKFSIEMQLKDFDFQQSIVSGDNNIVDRIVQKKK